MDDPQRDAVPDPVQRFGSEIRRLRRERGLSQRAFTRLIGLSAHSNLADYERGRRVMPADLVRESERVLHVPVGQLEALRVAALAARAPLGEAEPPCLPPSGAAPGVTTEGDPALSFGTDTPGTADADPSDAVSTDTDGDDAPSGGGRRHRAGAWRPLALLSAGATLPLGVFVVAWLTGQVIVGTPSPNVIDGADPVSTRCSKKTATLDEVRLYLDHDVRAAASTPVAAASTPVTAASTPVTAASTIAAGTWIGTLELRYALVCDTVWARFEPSSEIQNLPAPLSVAVTAARPADGVSTTYRVNRLSPAFGDMYVTWRGCVKATAEVTLAGGQGHAVAATRCLRGPANMASPSPAGYG